MAAAGLDLKAVTEALKELNNTVEDGFRDLSPRQEASIEATSRIVDVVKDATAENKKVDIPSLGLWKDMKKTLDDMGKDSGTADISRALTLQQLGEISESTSMAELAQRDQTVGLMKSIDSWAQSNDMNLDGLSQTFRDGSVDSIDSITDSLSGMMTESGMHNGQIFDELKDMNVELAESFARQYDFDVARWRTEKEMLDEAARKTGDTLDGKEATDMSLDLSIGGILAAIAAVMIGFVQGYIAELKLIGGGLVRGIKAIGKDAKAIWNFGKAWLKETKFVKWLGRVKSWFNTKIGAVLVNLKNAWKESTLGKLMTRVKSWFSTNIGAKLTNLKAAWQESKLAKLITRIKTWFSTPIGAKLGSIKAMFAESAIGRFIKSVKGLAGKSAFLDELGKGVTKIKSMFTAGGPGIFARLSTWIKSFKIPFPKWLDDLITKIKAFFPADPKTGKTFLGKMGAFFGKLFVWFQVITALFDFWGGWTDTKGSLWDKLWGGLSAALKGFINSFLDLGIMIEDGIKWIIKKIAGFFGFDEDAVGKAMEGFSIFKPIKKGFNAIVDWIVKLMTNPLAAFDDLFGGVASVGLWIYNMALKPLWDWFEGMFPDAAAFIKPFFTGIASLGQFIYDKALKPAWDWIKGMFSFGDDSKPDDGGSILDTLLGLVTGIWTWFKGLFDFSSVGAGIASAAKLIFLPLTALLSLVTGVWTWFKGLFGWDEEKKPGEQESGGVLSFLTGMVTGVWTWFKGLFDFSSFGAGLASAARLIFLPWTALLDLVGGVWTWFKGIFGFKDPEPADPRTLSQKLGGLIGDVWTWFMGIFGFGEDDKPKEGKSFVQILGDALANVWTWIKSIFDIDLKSVAKSIMPGWMYSWFYDDAEVPTEGAKAEPPSKTAAKPPTQSLTEADVTKIMESIDFRMFDFGSIFSYDLNFGESLKQTLTDAMMGGIPGLAVQKAAKGALVGMKMPAGGALGLEDGGLFTLSQGEMVLDNQAAQTFLAAAQLLTGADLAGLQRETNALNGAGTAPIIIQDNSQNVSNQSQPLVLPTPAMAPANGGPQLER